LHANDTNEQYGLIIKKSSSNRPWILYLDSPNVHRTD